MAAQTGRTVARFVKVQIKDPATLRDIPVNAINGVGLDYDEIEIVAWQDAIKGVLTGQPNESLELTGPWDTSAAQAASGSTQAAALSGSHTVLQPLNGALTPVTVAIYMGVRHNWETGEPVFGLSNSVATNGYIVVAYDVDWSNSTYKAKLRLASGSAAPAWGTAALT